MSRRKRNIYLLTLTAVFILVLPIVISYAVGYRFNDISFLGIIRTGGIFVRTDRVGVEVYLDDKIERKTSVFQRNFLISGLKIGLHQVSVKADGYNEWDKYIEVYAEKVTEINPFLVPLKTNLSLLPKYILPDGSSVTATSTGDLKNISNKKINPDFVSVSNLFASSTLSSIATSSRSLFASADFDFSNKKGLILKNKLALWQDSQGLSVQWLGEDDGTPYYFCYNDTCDKNKKIPIAGEIRQFDFYPGKNNYILVSLENGIYVYEIDDRSSTQNNALLVPGQFLDFRVTESGVLYVKMPDSNIYVVDL